MDGIDVAVYYLFYLNGGERDEMCCHEINAETIGGSCQNDGRHLDGVSVTCVHATCHRNPLDSVYGADSAKNTYRFDKCIYYRDLFSFIDKQQNSSVFAEKWWKHTNTNTNTTLKKQTNFPSKSGLKSFIWEVFPCQLIITYLFYSYKVICSFEQIIRL